MGRLNTQRLGRYLDATIQLLRQDPGFGLTESRIQGEGLKVVQKTGGTHEVQSIRDRGKFRWEQGKHLWWRDAEVGDELVVEFEVAGAESQTFQVFGDFTMAADYGAARLLIDGNIVRPITISTIVI